VRLTKRAFGPPNGWGGRLAAVLAVLTSLVSIARAEDEVEASTTYFQEPRQTSKGLTVVHPQLGLGFDLGSVVNIHLGYSADVVSGATPKVFSVDAVSTATEFSDTRHAGSFSLGFNGRRSSLAFNGAVAGERDYLSIAVGASASVDLPGKNTQFTLSYMHNMDEVCDRDNDMANGPFEKRALSIEKCNKNFLLGVDSPAQDQMGVVGDGTIWRDLTIDTAQAAVTQNISPTLVAQLSLYGAVLDGFQSNPYRRVRVGLVEAQETVPDVRARIAVSGRVNKYLSKLDSAVGFAVRGYSDTWGVNSVSGEMSYSQYVGRSLLVRFRGRVYQQDAAKFFKDAFFYETESSARAYFTGDRELAPLRDITTGAKLTYVAAKRDGKAVWGLFDELLFNLKADVMFYKELQAESGSANPVGIGTQYATSTGVIDAIVLQIGLRLRY